MVITTFAIGLQEVLKIEADVTSYQTCYYQMDLPVKDVSLILT